jgi:type IV pilus assembly protein PilM
MSALVWKYFAKAKLIFSRRLIINKMFGLFGSGKNYSIGIDFGTSAIKIVELLRKDQKIYLENYGWVDLGLVNPSSVTRVTASESQISSNKRLQKYLQKLIKSMKLKSHAAYISLPGFSGLIATIDFPEMNKEELDKAVRFEARKYIPISIDEVALDWEILEEKPGEAVKGIDKNSVKGEENKETEKKPSIWNRDLGNVMDKGPNKSNASGKKMEVLIVAAPKSEVVRCGTIVKEAGLNVKNIELELFSLVRAMVGNDPGCFLVIDIGSRMTNIILVEKGMIRVNRNIEGGGIEITNVIADSLNISKQRAEELKKENKDLINSREISLVIPVLDAIANESLRIINAYKEKKGAAGRVDGIILSGGSSKLEGLDKYFSQKIGVQTSAGNPWKKIVCSEKLIPFTEKMGASFSVALGLALRGIEDLDNE